MTAQFSEILVWVLVHSLWQGIVIAGCVSLALRWLPARRAEARYTASVTGLAVVVLCALVTWSVVSLDVLAEPTVPATNRVAVSPPDVPGSSATTVSRTAETVEPATSLPDIQRSAATRNSKLSPRNWTAWVAGLWMTGAAVMLLRTILAIVEVRQWRTSRGQIPQTGLGQLQAVVEEVCLRLHLRRMVTLILSDRVNVPAVVGAMWPCILIPPAMLTGIPLDQWRVILAHELAHIRRYDALVNLVQMMIESLLFFNPAVWWLSRQIRIEREACCDALAAEVCGQPLSVARTLVEFAAGLQGDARWPADRGSTILELPATTRSNAVMAFADPEAPGELTDRVQRLVEPEVAARPRMSWMALLVVLCSLAIAVEALHLGTSVAVQTAARLMSPKERVAKLESLQSQTSAVFFPPETPPAVNDTPAGADSTVNKASNDCQITVVVRTADGAPVPQATHLTSSSQNGNSSSFRTLDGLNEDSAEYRKVIPFTPCLLRIAAYAEGFAPAMSEILKILPGDKERTVELILQRGKTVTVQIVGPQGQPVADAGLRVNGALTLLSGYSSLGAQELVTDRDGKATVQHVGDIPYRIAIRASGYQRKQLSLEKGIDESRPITLSSATPVRMTVLDQVTGKPVPHARVVAAVLRRANSSHMLENPRRTRPDDKWANFAETDESGKAVLNELEAATRYTFGVVAEGYAMRVIGDVYGGQPDIEVKLAPPLKLAGRIEGDLNRLQMYSFGPREKPRRSLGYQQQIDQSHSDYAHVPVEDDGHFEINGLMESEKLTFNLSGQYVDYVMTKSITDAVLKIGTPEEKPRIATRKVIIRLTGTSPDAPARGTLYVSWNRADRAATSLPSGNMPLRGNEVHLEAPVGGNMYLRPENLVGYRIEEVSDIEITAGTEPQVIEVPTTPAGGIHVTITRADGSPATGAYITVFASQLPPGHKNHNKINPSSSSASATHLASLPLGGKYRVVARETGDSHNVWAVSDEIAIDEATPIAEIRLQLPRGRDFPVKVFGSDGAPLANQTVSIGLGFSEPGGYSNSIQVNRITGADGVALFDEMSIDAPVAPLEFSLSAEVVSRDDIGWLGKLPLKDPAVIQLQKGVSTTGVVIEANSGKPIPMASIRVMPRDFSSAKFKGLKQSVTDAKGVFHFSGLEPIEYTAYVEGAVPKGTVITRVPSGGLQFSYPSGVTQNSIDARNPNGNRLEVIIHPDSRLKVAD